MDANDPFLEALNQQSKQSLDKYTKRFTLQQVAALNIRTFKDQYDFLGYSSAPFLKAKQLRKEHLLPQIWGSKMKSIIDDQIYAIFCQAPNYQDMDVLWPIFYEQSVAKVFMILPKSSVSVIEIRNIGLSSIKKLYLTINTVLKIEKSKKRELVVNGPKGDRIIEHIHYKAWNDGDVPDNIQTCTIFRQLVQEAAKTIENNSIVAIHCRAGIGRTGTFGCTIEALRSIQKFGKVSFFEILANMRNYRNYCVQTFGQYMFIRDQLLLFE